MAHLTLEVNTTRGLAAQILRHRSFNFQEFSQRYADTTLLAEDIPLFELRRQDNKNRQNSIDDIDQEIMVKIRAKNYCATNKQNVIICGHTHMYEVDESDTVHYYNTGSWTTDPCSYLVIKDSSITIEHIS